MGHKDVRLGKIIYILVVYDISFSWLLPLDCFQFNCYVTVKTIYYGVLCRCDNRPIKSLTKDSGGLEGKVHRTKFPQNIHLFCYRVIFRVFFFFSLLHFLSVLIFKHKSQTNRPSVIARLIEYDRRASTCYKSTSRSFLASEASFLGLEAAKRATKKASGLRHYPINKFPSLLPHFPFNFFPSHRSPS